MRWSSDTTTSWRSSPRYACGPSRDGDEGLLDHHGSSCAHGNRECVCGSYCAAGTCASRHISGLCGTGSILSCSRGVKLQMVETDSLPLFAPEMRLFRRERESKTPRFCLAEQNRHLLGRP